MTKIESADSINGSTIMDVIETHIPEDIVISSQFQLANIWLNWCVYAMKDSKTWADLQLLDIKQQISYSELRELCQEFITEFDRTKGEIPSLVCESIQPEQWKIDLADNYNYWHLPR
jgi:hypothetical protein